MTNATKPPTLAQRIIQANTITKMLDLTKECEAILKKDPRLKGLPAPDAPYSDAEEKHAVEPPDLDQYEDALRAVCFIGAGRKPVCPEKCEKCHKEQLLVQLGYGKNHSGCWYIRCTVRTRCAVLPPAYTNLSSRRATTPATGDARLPFIVTAFVSSKNGLSRPGRPTRLLKRLLSQPSTSPRSRSSRRSSGSGARSCMSRGTSWNAL